jgi:high-affinity iron transporter
MIALALVYLQFKEKRAAMKKIESGQLMEDGDEALKRAKNYVNDEGIIMGQQDTQSSSDTYALPEDIEVCNEKNAKQ